ncbi:interleukin-27 subunit alpha-like [Eublepharis macularius]|uniref:Interleukin-27 subunit alpha-like n=1 Tax=Eublepharis macularius TaxID=481883 RepID=A0AA97K7Q3_EUBMA|nr:interleukin-27 subunit alpha-like [Eublepharis macularius]
MRLWGAVLFLQTLPNLFFFAATAPTGLQEEKGSGLTAPPGQVKLQKEFGISLKISRQILCKIRILTRNYLSARLSGAQLTLVPHSEDLPSVSLNFSSWISLSNDERLSHVAKMLLFYRGLMQQLKDYEAMKEDSKFTAQFEELGWYLRDLSHHVKYQRSLWGMPSQAHLEPTLKPPQIVQHQSQWRNRLEVNLVLRSLKNLLCRIVRDFLLLRTRVAKSLPATLE